MTRRIRLVPRVGMTSEHQRTMHLEQTAAPKGAPDNVHVIACVTSSVARAPAGSCKHASL